MSGKPTEELMAAPEDNWAAPELTDMDIQDAMQHIPGYLDITTQDFREIYELAHHHALDRLMAGLTARRLMQTSVPPVGEDMMLDQAAKQLVKSGFKALPVVDRHDRVTGMLTETDFLRLLKVDSFLSLLLKMLDHEFEFENCCHETPVQAVMTSPVVFIGPDADFSEMLDAFHKHPGRSMPVVGESGQLLGLLLRKDFLSAFRQRGQS